MQTNNKSIVQNIISQSIGKTFSYFLNFISITIAARNLGVENFGIFTSILALVTITAKFIDSGFSQIVFRETSRKKDFEYINNALTVRFILSFVVLLVFNLCLFAFQLDFKEVILSNALYLNVFISSRFTNFRELFEIRFRVDFKMHLVMITNLADNIILLILVILMAHIQGDLSFFVIIYSLSNLPGFVVIIYLLFKLYNYRFKFLLNRSKCLFKESRALFVLVLVLAIHQQLDIIYLKYSDSAFSAGIYSAAVRLTTPLSIIPIAFISTFFPIIIENIEIAPNKNQIILRIIYKTLLLFAMFPFLLILFKAKEFSILFFGDSFVAAFKPTILLFAANIFLYSNYFSLDLCTAYRKQYISFYYSLIILFINVGGLYFLVQDYSYTGAAYSKIISVLVGWVFLTFVVVKFKLREIKFRKHYALWAVFIFISAYIFSGLNIFNYIIFTSLSFLIITLTFSYYTYEDLNLILTKVNKQKWLPILQRISLFR